MRVYVDGFLCDIPMDRTFVTANLTRDREMVWRGVSDRREARAICYERRVPLKTRFVSRKYP